MKTKHVGIAVLIIIAILGVIAYLLFFNPSNTATTPPNPTITASYPKVFITIVSNFSNSYLNQTLLDKNLYALIPNLTISYLDFNTPEGQALQNQVNASFIPFYVFNSSIINSPAFPSLLKILTPKPNGNYLLYNFETNQGALINSSEKPFSLMLFVDPYQPASWAAENQTYNFLNNFNHTVNFSINYAISLNGSEYLSANPYGLTNGNFQAYSSSDLLEITFQLCMQQQNFTDLKYYLNCLNRLLPEDFNASNVSLSGMFFRAALSSQSCVEGVGAYNITQLVSCGQTCFNQTNTTQQICIANQTLIKQQYQLNQQYEITASPTYVFNNKYVYFGSILTPQQLQSILCQLNQC